MIDLKYLKSCINDLPLDVYILFALVFLIVSLFLYRFRRNKIKKDVSRLFLFEYCLLIFASTVFYRPLKDGVNYDLRPLWSYQSIYYGNYMLIYENLFNFLAFTPIGFALFFSFNVRNLLISVFGGLLFSLLIESFQIFFRRGFAEFDDIIHNTLGCIIGYLIAVSLCRIKKCSLSE